MKTEIERVLTRWQSLESEGGLQRAVTMTRVLWLVGLALCTFVVLAVAFRLHPAFVAVAAAALGWVIAECNALRSRLEQWPTLKAYIDWKKVDGDMGGRGR